MLTQVEATNSQGAVLRLPLDDISEGLVVAGIEGLEPVKATLVSSSFAQIDGAQYQSSRREARNIKIKLEVEQDFTTHSVRDIRRRLYSFFMPKTEVKLTFRMVDGNGPLDTLDLDIVGRVEEFTAPLFSQNPVIDISLMCYDPDFIDPRPVVFSDRTSSTLGEQLVTYDGTVETGIVFTLNANRPINEFTVYHRPPDGTFRHMEFSAPLLSGDRLAISTSVGAKSVTRTRSAVESPLLYGLSPQSHWIELQPGDNYFRVYAEGAGVPYDIQYVTKYGGL